MKLCTRALHADCAHRLCTRALHMGSAHGLCTQTVHAGSTHRLCTRALHTGSVALLAATLSPVFSFPAKTRKSIKTQGRWGSHRRRRGRERASLQTARTGT